jgi:predicted RNA polymerase sigma factor
VIGVLVHRGVDFTAAEDAVQEALIQAALTWPDRQPADPKGWLVTVAWRKFLDARRSEASRRDREQRVEVGPPPGPTETADDTLQLFFLCTYPSLTPASAVALTLRAVGGLTTRQIAPAYLVPEATMAQRISRAKRTVGDVRFEEPGDLATVLRVLYLVFNEGYSGDVDLAAEAIRLRPNRLRNGARRNGGTGAHAENPLADEVDFDRIEHRRPDERVLVLHRLIRCRVPPIGSGS